MISNDTLCYNDNMDLEKITAMRAGGKILGQLLADLKNHVKPGMSEKEIDAWVREQIIARGAGVAYDLLDDDFKKYIKK